MSGSACFGSPLGSPANPALNPVTSVMASGNTYGEIGFSTQAFIPTARYFSQSPFIAFAVSVITGISDNGAGISQRASCPVS